MLDQSGGYSLRRSFGLQSRKETATLLTIHINNLNYVRWQMMSFLHHTESNGKVKLLGMVPYKPALVFHASKLLDT